ncbi:MAG TPA: Ig-like domain-containing protein [Galbitalea sp.]|jgi:LPXTG-motif cell wall-anchored protein|nr:Ig-like domain-containing protein [Galbitalea sp.]
MDCVLPATGTDIWSYIGIGLLLLLGGVVVMAVSRRRVAPIIAAVVIALLAVGGLTLAPAQSASAAGGCPVVVPVAAAVADINTVTAETPPDPITGDVLTNDTDSGGFTLTVTNAGPAITMTYGTLNLAADGTYSYDLDDANATVSALPSGDTLTDVFTYDITDGHGGTASTTLTITILGSNHPPVANSDTNTIAANADPNTVTGNVLSNDTDPDGDTLTVTTTTTQSGNYGTLAILSNGDYTYTLNEGSSVVSQLPINTVLTEGFSYSISDGHGGTATSTVSINIAGRFDVG